MRSLIIVSIIFLYQGQRRVPVQQARRVVGRKMFAGRSTYIPLRLNNAGVISIIFAISILLLPQQALSWFGHGQTISGATLWADVQRGMQAFSAWLNVWFTPNGVLYNIVYFLLVVVFTFFYSSIVLNTRDVADNLKKSGSFIPGIRPGQPTVDYLNKILMRITTAAAIYLGLLAVLPGAFQRGLSITTFYLGSTSLLIVVGVALDTITQIEARLRCATTAGSSNGKGGEGSFASHLSWAAGRRQRHASPNPARALRVGADLHRRYPAPKLRGAHAAGHGSGGVYAPRRAGSRRARDRNDRSRAKRLARRLRHGWIPAHRRAGAGPRCNAEAPRLEARRRSSL